MMPADQRQTDIFHWLRTSPLAGPLPGGEEGDFCVMGGCPVRLKGGPVQEVLSWLELEGFDEGLLLAGFTVYRDRSAESGVESLIFRQGSVIDVHFESAPARPFDFYDESPF